MSTLELCPYAFDDYAEDPAPLEPVVACNPVAQPGVILFRDWVLRRAGGRDMGIVRGCERGAASKHHEGRAWDWGPATADDGHSVWLQMLADDAELARRAGLRTMIWWRQIWIAGATDVAPYRGASPHRDHIHFGFGWAGAKGETSLYDVIDAELERSTDALKSQQKRSSASLSLPALPGLADQPRAFHRALVRTALELDLNPDHLAAVIGFETAGTWSPRIRNPHTSAVGLIQWTRQSLRAIYGITTEAASRMSAIEQLAMVAEWMRRAQVVGRPDVRDVYLAVFAPAFVGVDPSTPLYGHTLKSKRAYAVNAALDADGDGVITAAEAAAGPSKLLLNAQNEPRIKVQL